MKTLEQDLSCSYYSIHLVIIFITKFYYPKTYFLDFLVMSLKLG